ncbi:hypothetical protein I79_001816 [Cricetulus griseus]|uniref:Uncharacterized protein n=1 Tax=Cricetulus griseus TaxID=10029 RepID=G3GVR9_CRIGR|nr:hypothetical protein I79_001816 [Cricetulus griseus]
MVFKIFGLCLFCLPACICTTCVPGSPGMEFQTDVSHHLSAGNQTWLLYINSKWSKLLNHL